MTNMENMEGDNMMKLNHTTSWGETYELKFYKGNYTNNNNLAIQSTIEEDGFEEPWSMVTVNIDPLPENWACIDTNNNGNSMLTELIDAGYCHVVGYKASGFCEYPVVEFTNEFLEEVEEMR